jgi:hypothetical protein
MTNHDAPDPDIRQHPAPKTPRKREPAKPFSDQELADLEARMKLHEARVDRAAARLVERPPQGLYFALIGLSTSFETLSIGDIASIDAITEPPDEWNLTEILSRTTYFRLAHIAERITHELHVRLDESSGDASLQLRHGFAMLALMRLRLRSDFTVAAVADHSWATIITAQREQLHLMTLEDGTRSMHFSPTRAMGIADAEWISENFVHFTDLQLTERFSFAVGCYYESFTETDLRMPLRGYGPASRQSSA